VLISIEVYEYIDYFMLICGFFADMMRGPCEDGRGGWSREGERQAVVWFMATGEEEEDRGI
jgi:hypothetical protein